MNNIVILTAIIVIAYIAINQISKAISKYYASKRKKKNYIKFYLMKS